MLLREIIPVYFENHTNPLNTLDLYEQNVDLLDVKAGDTTEL
jgi:hypothetical protein